MLEFFKKRRLRKELSKYLSLEAIQEIIDGRALDTPRIRTGPIEFIFAFVRADLPEELARRIALVVQAASDHQALVHNVIGPMIVMAFGTVEAAQTSGLRQPLITHLQHQLPGDIKIVHGASHGQ